MIILLVASPVSKDEKKHTVFVQNEIILVCFGFIIYC